ncbi:hypothetical protein CEXT_329671 [Caerostris extrusa]|uniref:Uncharacterized protein n=1 Tax=Caerostris extrusa TaxID=172846 RepID=A0AAV4T9B1_CAEEX|nr:hypothetical protein CEXT_329671 [Caerostris extrusa]
MCRPQLGDTWTSRGHHCTAVVESDIIRGRPKCQLKSFYGACMLCFMAHIPKKKAVALFPAIVMAMLDVIKLHYVTQNCIVVLGAIVFLG